MAAGPCGALAGAEADGTALRGRRVLGVQREQDVLADEIATVDVAVARDRHRLVLDADHEVDGARAQVVERRRRLALDDLDLEVGRVRREPVEHARQQRERRRLHERHPQPSARRVAQRRELRADRLVRGERLRGVARQPLAGGRQLDVAADPAQELRAGLALELGELDGDRRRAVREDLGDRGDRAEPGELVEQAQAAQFHPSDSRTNSRRESALVLNGRPTQAGAVVFFSLLLAPLVLTAAAQIERRLGAAAAGWVAALPVSFAVAVAAVTLEAGGEPARAMALSAATHVPAQVAFAVAFAGVLTRHGLMRGAAAGVVAYVACSIALAGAPDALLLAGAVAALALAPRLMTAERVRPGSPRRWPATVLTCAGASTVVGGALVTMRLAGPEAAGAVAAFPTVSTALAVAVVLSDGAVGRRARARRPRPQPPLLSGVLPGRRARRAVVRAWPPPRSACWPASPPPGRPGRGPRRPACARESTA